MNASLGLKSSRARYRWAMTASTKNSVTPGTAAIQSRAYRGRSVNPPHPLVNAAHGDAGRMSPRN